MGPGVVEHLKAEEGEGELAQVRECGEPHRPGAERSSGRSAAAGAERHSAFLAEANIGAGSQREREAGHLPPASPMHYILRSPPPPPPPRPSSLEFGRMQWNNAVWGGGAPPLDAGVPHPPPLPESCLPAVDLPPTTELALAAARVRQRLTHAAELAALLKNYPTAR